MDFPRPDSPDGGERTEDKSYSQEATPLEQAVEGAAFLSNWEQTNNHSILELEGSGENSLSRLLI